MKPSDNFKKVISDKLQEIAQNDSLFAVTLQKENKNIDECINYIFQQVQKSGCNGFADDDIFNMAIHYYDEDSIETISPIDFKVVVNHHVELTAEEIQEAKDKAKEKVFLEEQTRLKKIPSSKPEAKAQQTSLF